MAITKSAGYETGTAGNSLSTSDAGDATPFNSVSHASPNTLTYESASIASDGGSMLAKHTLAGGSTTCFWAWSLASLTDYYARGYFAIDTIGTTVQLFAGVFSSFTWKVQINSTGHITLTAGTSGTARATSAKTFSADEPFRLELHVQHGGTGADALTCRLFYGTNIEGSTADEEFGYTGQTMGGASDGQIRVGHESPAVTGVILRSDAVAIGDAWIGPAGSSSTTHTDTPSGTITLSGSLVESYSTPKPYVGRSSSAFEDVGAATTISTTLETPVGAGNGVLVIGDMNSNDATSATITDDQGNTYTLIDAVVETHDAISWSAYYCPDASGAQTFTQTTAVAARYRRIIVMELGNVNGVDVHSIENVTTATPTPTSPSVTPTQDGDLVIGYIIASQGMNEVSPWLPAAMLEGFPVCIYQVQDTAAAIQAEWSQPSQQYAAGIVTFKVAGTTYTDTPSGSITLSGSLVESHTFTDSPSGTIALSGSLSETYTPPSTTYTDTPTGTITLSGSLTESYSTSSVYTDTPSGTLTLSGSLVESHTLADAVSGTITLSGSLTERRVYTDTPSGTISLSGSVTRVTSRSSSPTGTLTLSGSLAESHAGANDFHISPATDGNPSMNAASSVDLGALATSSDGAVTLTPVSDTTL